MPCSAQPRPITFADRPPLDVYDEDDIVREHGDGALDAEVDAALDMQLPAGGDLSKLWAHSLASLRKSLEQQERLFYEVVTEASRPKAEALGPWVESPVPRALCEVSVQTEELPHHPLPQFTKLDDLAADSSSARPASCVRTPRSPRSPSTKPVDGGFSRSVSKSAVFSVKRTLRSQADPSSHQEYETRRAEQLGIDLDGLLSTQRHAPRGSLVSCISGVLVWWVRLREPPRSGRLACFIRSCAWESLVAIFIVASSILLGYSANFVTQDPYVARIEDALLVFFCIEITLRICVHRWYFFANDGRCWNVYDLCIVLISLYAAVPFLVTRSSANNITFMRSLRLLRLGRTLRIVRIFRYASSLRRMMLSLLGSSVTLFWSLVLLFFVFFLFSIATVQGVTDYLSTSPIASPEDDALVASFGTVFDAMMSYFMATSGGNDWSMYFDLLNSASPVTAWLFVSAVGFTQIALLNIITGVFVDTAMKFAQPDRQTLARERRYRDFADAAELRRTVAKLDEDATGTVTWEEFKRVAADHKFASQLRVMGLEINEPDMFFAMLSSASESADLDLEVLIQACLLFKGPASCLDLHLLSFKADLIHDSLASVHERLDTLANEVGL